MTEEEFERLKDSIRAKLTGDVRALQPDEKEIASRRKLDHDMDRIERMLKKIIAEQIRERREMRERDKNQREQAKNSAEPHRVLSKSKAESDMKLKALIESLRRKPNAESS